MPLLFLLSWELHHFHFWLAYVLDVHRFNPLIAMSVEYDGKTIAWDIVGENVAEFKSEASVILKKHAPMQYARWKKIPTDRKKMLWLAMKEVGDRNKRNRDKLKMAHTRGTKSIAQYCYEERDPETGQEPTRTSTWMKTQFSNKKKDWIDDASREAYVLGPKKPSRLRGCGDGLKPPSKRGESINRDLAKENEELRKQADADRECTQSLMRENKELASR
ncbi:hypothetical protein PHJA_001163800 [Phtheirospermum japonicum]|uniref:Uncharacterized protein n=1 Tax=Phtheirospermum japonicum TaxID=374723 RepID=A0A830BVH0_9LAMI|nr:hypothetical protein PHJA_001163800 [Phtheirospermum japonicum]